jgi:hypothetical protein
MKMKILFAALTALLCTSCASRYMYSPSAHNVPVFTKQGDSKIAASYSVNGGNEDNSGKGVDLQGAYAITKHVAVQAGYSTRNEKTVDSNFSSSYFNYSTVKYKRQMFEAGAGYFRSIHKRDKIFFSAYAGMGFGEFSFKDTGRDNNQLPYARFHNANVTKYYLQAGISFINRGFVTSVSGRATVVDFNKIKTNYSVPEQDDLEIDGIDNNAYIFFEPAVVLSYQFKRLPGMRIECQVGFSAHLRNEDNYLAHTEAGFSAGLVFDLPKFIGGFANKRRD